MEPATQIAHSPPPQAAGQPERFSQHREGYLRQPVSPGEFSDFEDEQVWID